MKGLSITLCFGKYGGFHFYFTAWSWRVCLGWMALTIYPQTDLEAFIEHLKETSFCGHTHNHGQKNRPPITDNHQINTQEKINFIADYISSNAHDSEAQRLETKLDIGKWSEQQLDEFIYINFKHFEKDEDLILD
jgi:hypothetical protein